MTPEQKLIRIVENARGDDLERATMAFGRMSEAELDQMWGQSGKTCREVFEEYRRERELYLQAKELLMRRLKG